MVIYIPPPTPPPPHLSTMPPTGCGGMLGGWYDPFLHPNTPTNLSTKDIPTCTWPGKPQVWEANDVSQRVKGADTLLLDTLRARK